MHVITNTVLTDKRVLSRIYSWFPVAALPANDRQLYKQIVEEYKTTGELLSSQRCQQFGINRDELHKRATKLTSKQVEKIVNDAAQIARRWTGRMYIETRAANEWQEDGFSDVIANLKQAALIGAKSLHEPLLYGEHLDYYDFRQTKAGKPIATPFPRMNILFGGEDATGANGGFMKGETYLVASGSKSGKTTFMLNCGLAAVIQGYNVLYITLELKPEEIATRLDARVLETRLKDLILHPDRVKQDIPALIARKFAGYFHIESMLGGTGTLEAIDSIIQSQIDRGYAPDMVIVDYGDLVAVDDDNEVSKYKKIFQELFRMGQRYNVVLLSARQVHQAAQRLMDAGTKKRYNSSDMRGGSGPIDDVSCTFTINQTGQERKMHPPRARIYIDKSRVSASGTEITIAYYHEKFMFAELIEEE